MLPALATDRLQKGADNNTATTRGVAVLLELATAAPGRRPAGDHLPRARQCRHRPRAGGGSWAGKDARAVLDTAALGIGRAVVEPAQPGEGDRLGAHRAGLQGDVEVAVDQPRRAELPGARAGSPPARHGRWDRCRFRCGWRPRPAPGRPARRSPRRSAPRRPPRRRERAPAPAPSVSGSFRPCATIACRVRRAYLGGHAPPPDRRDPGC